MLIIILLAMFVFTSCTRTSTQSADVETVVVNETNGKETEFDKNDNVIPTQVVITINDDVEFAILEGFHIRVNPRDDIFFSHRYFVAMEDLEMLAKKRNVKFNFDKKNKKLELGEQKHNMVMVDKNIDTDLKAYDLIYYDKAGKIYVDTWGFYYGLGFAGVYKTDTGVHYYEPRPQED
jgi:hypothetical protein